MPDRYTFAERRAARRRARQIARQAWIEHPGDPDKAMDVASQRVRDEMGSIVTILAIVQFVIMLIRWWSESSVSVPPDEPMAGEPGGGE